MYMRWANVGLGHLPQSLLAHWASVLCHVLAVFYKGGYFR